MAVWLLQEVARALGHALVVMLAYLIVHELAQCWRHLDLTVQEGLDKLATLSVHLPGQSVVYQHPLPESTPPGNA